MYLHKSRILFGPFGMVSLATGRWQEAMFLNSWMSPFQKRYLCVINAAMVSYFRAHSATLKRSVAELAQERNQQVYYLRARAHHIVQRTLFDVNSIYRVDDISMCSIIRTQSSDIHHYVFPGDCGALLLGRSPQSGQFIPLGIHFMSNTSATHGQTAWAVSITTILVFAANDTHVNGDNFEVEIYHPLAAELASLNSQSSQSGPPAAAAAQGAAGDKGEGGEEGKGLPAGDLLHA